MYNIAFEGSLRQIKTTLRARVTMLSNDDKYPDYPLDP